MILIHVWADGSFTTQAGGRDMSPWAEHQQAAKHGCVATWLSSKAVDYARFCEEFKVLEERDLEIPSDGVMGQRQKRRKAFDLWPDASAWQLWASICIAEFGAWFEPVTGLTAEEELRDRLKRLISTRGEASLGVLVNLVRPIPCATVVATLVAMARNKTLDMEVRVNPRNRKETSIFSIATR